MKFHKFILMIFAITLFSFSGCSSDSDLPEPSETDPNTSQDPNTEQEETNNSSDEEIKNDETNEEANKKENNEENEEQNKEEGDDSMLKTTYSILFIGNSYTFYNDMPTAIFKTLAKSAGYEVEITTITNGGHTLEKMADPNDTYGAKVEKALNGTNKYDYVILQEQSVRPANESAEKFYAAVRNLSARIRESGATPILYSTWGRKTGSNTLTNNGWTNESMTWKLAAAYEAIGKELDIPVAHVGLAFYDIFTDPNPIDIYNDDKSHPNYAGSYLAAATLFAKIFNTDPGTLSYNGSLSAENATALLQAAAKAVFQPTSIPDEYITTSK